MTSCKPPPTCIDASPIPDANDSRMSAIPYEANLTPMGAFPLQSTFWIRPASPLVRRRSGAFCSDPVPEYLAPIRLLAPLRSEFRLRLYPPLPSGASGRALRCLFLALSFASVALFQPYLPDGRYQASLGH